MDKESRIERFRTLPCRNETWQGDLVRMPKWVNDGEDEPFRPVLPLWLAVRHEFIHMGKMVKPQFRNLHLAVDAMLGFADEMRLGGYRPETIEVKDPALAEHLQGLLMGSDTAVVLRDRLPELEQAIEGFQHFESDGEPILPSMLDAAGVTVERVRAFAEAAAEFYRAAPWRLLCDLDLLRVEKTTALEIASDMREFVVLGNAQTIFGLGFYKKGRLTSGEWPSRDPSVISWQVTFDPANMIPIVDHDLWIEHELPVACDLAYPTAVRLGKRVRRPDRDELVYFEGLLHAMALTTEDEIDQGRWEKTVQTYNGRMRFRFAIPDLLHPPSGQEWNRRGMDLDRRALEKTSAYIERSLARAPDQDIEELERIINDQTTDFSLTSVSEPHELPAARAQEICYDAFLTFGRRRVQLARQALTIDPNCAEAYSILAEHAANPESRLEYYLQGVAAGERSISAEMFQNPQTPFWAVVSTRPYMRSLFGLGQTLEELERIDEAIEVFQKLLRLNANDNQGVRFILVPLLIEENRDKEADQLLNQYESPMASCVYAKALIAFRVKGDSPEARLALRMAFKTNRYVPKYLLEGVPTYRLSRFELGGPDEAVVASHQLSYVFELTPGALEWIESEFRAWRQEMRRTSRKKSKNRRRRNT